MDTCSVEGCDRPHEARTWCQTHYMRWYRSGDPLAARRLVRGSLAERLAAYLVPEGNCLVWTGGHTLGGYGVINRGRRGAGMASTHRLAWELAYGPVPDGMNVLHHCDNPPCCEPTHLFLGTGQDNSR